MYVNCQRHTNIATVIKFIVEDIFMGGMSWADSWMDGCSKTSPQRLKTRPLACRDLDSDSDRQTEERGCFYAPTGPVLKLFNNLVTPHISTFIFTCSNSWPHVPDIHIRVHEFKSIDYVLVTYRYARTILQICQIIW